MVPEDGKLRIEVRGALATILSMTAVVNAKSPGKDSEALALQIKMVVEPHPILICCSRDRKPELCQGWGRGFEFHRPLQFAFIVYGG